MSDSYLCPVLYLVDGELHRNVEAVQNIASKHQSVLGRINSMDPAWSAKYTVMKRGLVQITESTVS